MHRHDVVDDGVVLVFGCEVLPGTCLRFRPYLLVWRACGSARSVSRRIGGLGDRLVWGVALTRCPPVTTSRNQRGHSGGDDDQHEQLPLYTGKIRKCEPDHNLILIVKNL